MEKSVTYFTRSHVVPNLHLLLLRNTKEVILKNSGVPNSFRCHWLPLYEQKIQWNSIWM